jgi:hypothetical protein
MISNISLSAFSATTLRPTEPRTPSASQVAPVQAAPPVDRVRAQADTRPPEGISALERTPPQPAPGRPIPRGSLLDLSV